MSVIRVTCNDQVMSFVDMPVIASGGVNEDHVEFTFDASWSLYTKTAVFYRDARHVYHVAISGNRCIIPSEVLTTKGKIYFGVFGIYGSTIQTSEIVKYDIRQGAITSGVTITPPSGGGSGDYDEIYAEIMDELAATWAALYPDVSITPGTGDTDDTETSDDDEEEATE